LAEAQVELGFIAEDLAAARILHITELAHQSDRLLVYASAVARVHGEAHRWQRDLPSDASDRYAALTIAALRGDPPSTDPGRA
jgi:hypothetical protein